jgi:hypothetical protein
MTQESKSLQQNSERDPKPVASEFQLPPSTQFRDCDKCERTRLYIFVFLASVLLHFQGNVSTVLSALAACVATFLSRDLNLMWTKRFNHRLL